jgi:hypothetical protein
MDICGERYKVDDFKVGFFLESLFNYIVVVAGDVVEFCEPWKEHSSPRSISHKNSYIHLSLHHSP